jgi:hypothetical protein
MRSRILLLVMAIGALPQWAIAQPQPLLHVVATHVPLPTFDIANFKLQCPAGHIPTSYSAIVQYPYDVNEDEYRLVIDKGGTPVDKNALLSAAQVDGGGYSLSVYNTEHHAKNLEAMITCLSPAASADGTLQFARASGAVAKTSIGTVTAFCPAESPVAFGGYSSADNILVLDYGSAPAWGTSASPILLNSLADGTTMGPPTGWQVRVFNLLNATTVTAYAICGKAPTMTTFISAINAPGSAFGQPTPFSVYGAVPGGYTTVGSGFDGGGIAQYVSTDAWLEDGTVVGLQQWYSNATGYDSGAAQTRAFMVKGSGTGAGARAALAILAVPQTSTAPPPTQVGVVEFYNAALDHYFITANPDEMAKLDSGVFKGWARTGESFNAFGAGSLARSPSRRPVCREYGNPLYGLDSHFYSASPEECSASMVTTSGSWLLEATEVFQLDLPDASGNCPAGDVPVYRIWNKRRDSNHRYTTKASIRDQMVAKGGIAEGYGPNSVALCGLP